jgi:hypothetical protein
VSVPACTSPGRSVPRVSAGLWFGYTAVKANHPPPAARALSCHACALARRHDGTDDPSNLWLLWWNVPRGKGTNDRDGRRSVALREHIAAWLRTVGENAPQRPVHNNGEGAQMQVSQGRRTSRWRCAAVISSRGPPWYCPAAALAPSSSGRSATRPTTPADPALIQRLRRSCPVEPQPSHPFVKECPL